MAAVVLAMGVVALVLSLAGCGAALRVGRRAGLLDLVGGEAHKGHAAAVPNTGGVGVFAAVALPLLAAAGLVTLVPVEAWDRWPGLATHVPGARSVLPMVAWLLGGLAVLHAVGLVDDRRGLGPWVKLTAQVAVAAALTAAGVTRALTLLDQLGPAGVAASWVVSVGWVVVVVNAFNFLDNMDGLSAGVAVVAAAVFGAAAWIGGQWFVAGLAALTVGALLGFLVYNRPPARLFMGDGGSLVVGLLIAVLSVRVTYTEVNETGGVGGAGAHAWLTPWVVLAVPLYDFVSVTLIRLRAGKSPFAGDHNHFSHRLTRRGLTRPQAVGLVWLCALATGLGGVVLPHVAAWQAWLIAAQTGCVLGVVAVLEATRGTARE